MDKYTELVEQIKNELSWAKESLSEDQHRLEEANKDLNKVKGMDKKVLQKAVDELDKRVRYYDRGIVFAYKSIMSKIQYLEEEDS